MIPRKSQEVPRADSARKAPPLLTQSPVGGGDTAGQKKEGKYLLPGQLGPCDHRCGDVLGTGSQMARFLVT